MTTKEKSEIIGKIITELKLKAVEVGDKSFCEGDVFFSLAFKTDAEIKKIANLCRV